MRNRNLAALAALAVVLLPAVAFADTTTTLAQLSQAGTTDPAMTMLSAIFSPSLFGTPSGDSGLLLPKIVEWLNSIVLVAGAGLMTYSVVMATSSSAHSGKPITEVMGHLTPIRFAAAGGMLVPLPPFGGYNGFQLAIGGVIKLSMAMASIAYSMAMSFSLSGVAVDTLPGPGYEQLSHDVWRMAVCAASANQLAIMSGNPPVYSGAAVVGSTTDHLLAFQPTSNANTNDYIFSARSCGYLRGQVASDPTYQPIYDAHLTALAKMANSFYKVAAKIAAAGVQDGSADLRLDSPPSGAQAAREALAQSGGQLAADLATAEHQAESDFNTAQTAAVAKIKPPKIATDMNQIKADGWMSAGTFYNQLAIIQSRYDAARDALPFFTPPDATWQALLKSPTLAATINYGGIRNYSEKLFQASGTVQQFNTAPDLSSLYMTVAQVKQLPKFAANPSRLDGYVDVTRAAITNALNGMTQLFQHASDGLTLATVAGMKFALSAPIVSVIALGDKLKALVAILAYVWPSALGNILSIAAGAAIFASNILPLMPYYVFTIGVVSWLIFCVEAVVASSLWGFNHLRNGEHLHGAAGAGYGIALTLLFRPLLMIVGFFMSLPVTAFGIMLINATYGHAIVDSTAAANAAVNYPDPGGAVSLSNTFHMLGSMANIGSGVIGLVLTPMIQVGFYLVLCCVVVERAARLTVLLPDRVLRWAGGPGADLGEESHAQRVQTVAMAAAAGVGAAAGGGKARQPKKGNDGGNGGGGEGGEESRSNRFRNALRSTPSRPVDADGVRGGRDGGDGVRGGGDGGGQGGSQGGGGQAFRPVNAKPSASGGRGGSRAAGRPANPNNPVEEFGNGEDDLNDFL